MAANAERQIDSAAVTAFKSTSSGLPCLRVQNACLDLCARAPACVQLTRFAGQQSGPAGPAAWRVGAGASTRARASARSSVFLADHQMRSMVCGGRGPAPAPLEHWAGAAAAVRREGGAGRERCKRPPRRPLMLIHGRQRRQMRAVAAPPLPPTLKRPAQVQARRRASAGGGGA